MMKNIFKIVIAIFLTVATINAKEIIVGSDAEYPPFEYIDENGKISGFDIDLIGEISKIAGFEYKFIKVGLDALIPALKAGKVDVVIVDNSVGFGYLKKNSDIISFLEEADGSDGFAFAFDI